MKARHYILMIFSISFFNLNAQKIFKTEDGHIMMMALMDSLIIKSQSHKLDLYLDYDTKVINGALDLKSLSTNSLEVNAMLAEEEEPAILRFTGTITSDDFLSKRHDPILFNWLVTITYKGKSFKSSFKATITHIDQAEAMSCLISARGEVLTSNTGLNDLIQGLGKTIEVEFAQLVLKLE
jgi:alpha-tubulin suppressor-like RCC1 family protein